jgi:hypothetical protein
MREKLKTAHLLHEAAFAAAIIEKAEEAPLHCREFGGKAAHGVVKIEMPMPAITLAAGVHPPQETLTLAAEGPPEAHFAVEMARDGASEFAEPGLVPPPASDRRPTDRLRRVSYAHGTDSIPEPSAAISPAHGMRQL